MKIALQSNAYLLWIFLLSFYPSFSQKLSYLEQQGDSLLNMYQKKEAALKYKTALKTAPSSQLLYKLSLTYEDDIIPQNHLARKLLDSLIHSEKKDNLLLAKSYTRMGDLIRQIDLFDSAKVYLKKAIEIGKPFGYITPIDKMSRVLINQGNFEEALKYGFQALKEAEKNNNQSDLPSIYLNLGRIYKSLGQWNNAQQYLDKLIKIESAKPFSPFLGSAYEVYGNYYTDLGIEENTSKYAESIGQYYQKALEADKRVGYTRGTANQYMHLAMTNVNLNKFDKADQMFEQARTYFAKMESPTDFAGFYLNYGDFLFVSGRNKIEGLKLIEKAGQIFGEWSMKKNKAVTLEALSLGYEQLKDYQKAYEYSKKYQTLSNEILNETSLKEIENLKVKYETEKKDAQLAQQEVQLLQKQQRITQIALAMAILGLVSALVFIWIRHQQRLKIRKMESEFEQTAQQLKSFNYSISHDLRNPLIFAQNTLGMLHHTNLNEKQTEYVKKVDQSIHNMKSIIEGLLSLVDIEKNNLKLSVVNTNELVKDILSEFGEEVPIRYQNLPTIKADVRLARQVFTNLISNAIKYTASKANPSILIEGEKTDASTTFRITDNGVGFDNKFSNKLFQLFGRLHPDIQGIGIGLVIVKRIIEKHGGHIWANGEINKGATFSLEFPN